MDETDKFGHLRLVVVNVMIIKICDTLNSKVHLPDGQFTVKGLVGDE